MPRVRGGTSTAGRLWTCFVWAQPSQPPFNLTKFLDRFVNSAQVTSQILLFRWPFKDGRGVSLEGQQRMRVAQGGSGGKEGAGSRSEGRLPRSVRADDRWAVLEHVGLSLRQSRSGSRTGMQSPASQMHAHLCFGVSRRCRLGSGPGLPRATRIDKLH